MEDERKLSYALEECAGADPLPCSAKAATAITMVHDRCCCGLLLDTFSWQAIDWIAAQSSAAEVERREEMISKLEEADDMMRRSGASASWFRGADAHTRRVAGGANGALFEELPAATDYVDVECVDLLREGGHSHVALLVAPRRC